jgi:predicted transcriptional regulator
MKLKYKIIGIKSSEEALLDAAEAMQSIAQGRKTQHVSACYFASLKAFQKILTPQRYDLLKAIRKNQPSSVHELSAIVGRDLASVQEDVNVLVDMDFIELEHHGEQRTPRVHYEGIRVEMVM